MTENHDKTFKEPDEEAVPCPSITTPMDRAEDDSAATRAVGIVRGMVRTGSEGILEMLKQTEDARMPIRSYQDRSFYVRLSIELINYLITTSSS